MCALPLGRAAVIFDRRTRQMSTKQKYFCFCKVCPGHAASDANDGGTRVSRTLSAWSRGTLAHSPGAAPQPGGGQELWLVTT